MFIQIRQRCRVSTVLNLASSHLGRALHDQGKDSRILLIEILTSWVHHVTHVKGFTTAKKKKTNFRNFFMLDKKKVAVVVVKTAFLLECSISHDLFKCFFGVHFHRRVILLASHARLAHCRETEDNKG
jgi:hypothetical protein